MRICGLRGETTLIYAHERFRPLVLALLLPLASFAAERFVKIDAARSYVDVDVGVTIGSFTAHLDQYDLRVTADDKKSVKTAVLSFKFADLKTGDTTATRR
ncbi:MAG: hypothetical protein WDM96_13950 [Lacunisphaera sp.]